MSAVISGRAEMFQNTPAELMNFQSKDMYALCEYKRFIS